MSCFEILRRNWFLTRLLNSCWCCDNLSDNCRRFSSNKSRHKNVIISNRNNHLIISHLTTFRFLLLLFFMNKLDQRTTHGLGGGWANDLDYQSNWEDVNKLSQSSKNCHGALTQNRTIVSTTFLFWVNARTTIYSLKKQLTFCQYSFLFCRPEIQNKIFQKYWWKIDYLQTPKTFFKSEDLQKIANTTTTAEEAHFD